MFNLTAGHLSNYAYDGLSSVAAFASGQLYIQTTKLAPLALNLIPALVLSRKELISVPWWMKNVIAVPTGIMPLVKKELHLIQSMVLGVFVVGVLIRQQLLADACATGSEGLALFALNVGADVNRSQPKGRYQGRTPVELAYEKNHLGILQLFLRANPNAQCSTVDMIFEKTDPKFCENYMCAIGHGLSEDLVLDPSTGNYVYSKKEILNWLKTSANSPINPAANLTEEILIPLPALNKYIKTRRADLRKDLKSPIDKELKHAALVETTIFQESFLRERRCSRSNALPKAPVLCLHNKKVYEKTVLEKLKTKEKSHRWIPLPKLKAYIQNRKAALSKDLEAPIDKGAKKSAEKEWEQIMRKSQ